MKRIFNKPIPFMKT